MALKLNQSRNGLLRRFVVPVSAIFSVGIITLAIFMTWSFDSGPLTQMLVGMTVLLGVSLGSLYTLFRRSIGEPLVQLRKTVQQLEMGENAHSAEADEISRVTAGVTAYVDNVLALTSGASSAATGLGAAVVETTAAGAQTTLGIDNQRKETDEVALTVVSMLEGAREMAQTGVNAREAAETVNADAARGREVVSEAVCSITALASDVETAAEVLRNLERHSEPIGAVLDVIRGIAEQTNLLALNAAIEAARAGEQGRGFAVIADEVRTLASRTKTSTQEIQRMIERLQNGTQSAVAAMTQGHSQAEATVDHAKRAGEALDAIAHGVNTITSLNESMANAAETHHQLADQVQGKVEKIKELAEHSAEHSRQGTAATEEVSRRSNELISKIEMLRL